MTRGKADFEHAIGDWSARQLAAETHPSREQLEAYRLGRLDPLPMDSVQEHLALCPACAEMLLWLDDDGGLPEEPVAGTAAAPAEPARRKRPAFALAASVVLGIALGWWLRPVGGPPTPVTEIAFHHLHLPHPGERTAGSTARVQTVRVPRLARTMVLVIPVDEGDRGLAYGLELVRGNETLWRGQGAAIDHELTLAVPVSTLLPGPYRLRIITAAGEEFGEISFEIEPEDGTEG